MQLVTPEKRAVFEQRAIETLGPVRDSVRSILGYRTFGAGVLTMSTSKAVKHVLLLEGRTNGLLQYPGGDIGFRNRMHERFDLGLSTTRSERLQAAAEQERREETGLLPEHFMNGIKPLATVKGPPNDTFFVHGGLLSDHIPVSELAIDPREAKSAQWHSFEEVLAMPPDLLHHPVKHSLRAGLHQI